VSESGGLFATTPQKGLLVALRSRQAVQTELGTDVPPDSRLAAAFVELALVI
jgi:hypothetical protein